MQPNDTEEQKPRVVVKRLQAEDFEDVDESEIDGEERAHDRVNMIPNSQVNRNQGQTIT